MMPSVKVLLAFVVVFVINAEPAVAVQRHFVGVSPRFVAGGGVYGVRADHWTQGVLPSGGFFVSYRFQANAEVAVGARVGRWFLRLADTGWAASGDRFLATVEWAWKKEQDWSLFVVGGLGPSMVWTHESHSHYVAMGPAVSANLGYRRWFGNVGMVVEFGGEADWTIAISGLTDAYRKHHVSGVFWLGIGVEMRF
jgi:hypothetical protein